MIPACCRRLRRRSDGRVTGAAVAAALSVAALTAGCGIASRQTAHGAASNLKNAEVASFTFRIDDRAGELSRTGSAAQRARNRATLRSSALRITIDPPGSTPIGAGASPSSSASNDPVKELRNSGSIEVAYTSHGNDVADLRLVNGILYARVDPGAYRAATGQTLPLNEVPAPALASAVRGIRGGKWLEVDLATAYAKAKRAGLLNPAGRSAVPNMQSLTPLQARRLANALLAVAKPRVRTVETKSQNQILVSVTFDVKPALLGALDVMKRPEYRVLLGGQSAGLAALRKSVAALPNHRPLTGTISIQKGHVRQVALNLGSVARLSHDRRDDNIKTARLVVDVNDRASAPTAPPIDDVVSLDPIVGKAVSQMAKQVKPRRTSPAA